MLGIGVQRTYLDISFLVPYVGDKLVYKDPNSKKKGYILKSGAKSQSVEILNERAAYRKTQKKRTR